MIKYLIDLLAGENVNAVPRRWTRAIRFGPYFQLTERHVAYAAGGDVWACIRRHTEKGTTGRFGSVIGRVSSCADKAGIRRMGVLPVSGAGKCGACISPCPVGQSVKRARTIRIAAITSTRNPCAFARAKGQCQMQTTVPCDTGYFKETPQPLEHTPGREAKQRKETPRGKLAARRYFFVKGNTRNRPPCSKAKTRQPCAFYNKKSQAATGLEAQAIHTDTDGVAHGAPRLNTARGKSPGWKGPAQSFPTISDSFSRRVPPSGPFWGSGRAASGFLRRCPPEDLCPSYTALSAGRILSKSA